LVITGATVLGTMHDEIILEVPEMLANDAAGILKETMIKAGIMSAAGRCLVQ
jgi:DNA polymerase I-like protein with 3'-5' exonuclease and polymerase domains